jgi:DUF2924 family protein
MKSSPSAAEPDKLYGELASLPALGPERLKERWRILYGTEPPPRISEDLLRRAIAYRLQERAFGGLKPSTRRLLQRIAEDARPRSSSATPTRKLSAGAVLIREWQGTSHQVTVLKPSRARNGAFIFGSRLPRYQRRGRTSDQKMT